MAPARERQHGAAVERRQRSQIQNARLNTVRGECVRDAQADVHVGAIRNDGEVVAATAQRGLADRNRRRRRVAEGLADPRIAVERNVLVIEDRIRIGDGRRHQRARVVRRRRHDDLQSRRAIEPAFGVLRMIRAGVAQAAARHADDHRRSAAPSVPVLGRVVDELIEPRGDEVIELHLADRTLSGNRRADAHAEHAALADRRVDQAVAEFLEERPQQQERVAVRAADVLAVDEYARIGAQRITDAEHHGFEKRFAFRIERRSRLQSNRRARGDRRA